MLLVRTFILLLKHSGKLEDKSGLLVCSLLSINCVFKPDKVTALMFVRDFGRLRDMVEDVQMQLIVGTKS
jgi:hypothetical protein